MKIKVTTNLEYSDGEFYIDPIITKLMEFFELMVLNGEIEQPKNGVILTYDFVCDKFSIVDDTEDTEYYSGLIDESVERIAELVEEWEEVENVIEQIADNAINQIPIDIGKLLSGVKQKISPEQQEKLKLLAEKVAEDNEMVSTTKIQTTLEVGYPKAAKIADNIKESLEEQNNPKVELTEKVEGIKIEVGESNGQEPF